MSTFRMSVGRDYTTSSHYEYCIFSNEEIVARQGGFARSNQARSAGQRRALQLQAEKETRQRKSVPPIGADMLAALTGDLDAVTPDNAERARKLIALRTAAPLQSKGHSVEDAAHLPLFVAANEPKLF